MHRFEVIAAVDEEFGIAKNGALPWSGTEFGKEDMKWFKEKTINNIVIMGRKTWESIKCKPLKNRINIVLSRNYEKIVTTEFILTNSPIIYVSSFDFALNWCENFAPFKKILVIGGADIYSIVLSHEKFNALYLTIFKKNYDCDLKFPKLLKNAKCELIKETESAIYNIYH
jgi:dihydrofolate reductase